MTLLDDLIAANVLQASPKGQKVTPDIAHGLTPFVLTGDESQITPSQPSLLWKAYAQTLRPQLSLNNDLSAINQALFIASPLQVGIPANNVIPAEVTNYHTYVKADVMQTKNNPIYSVNSAAGSYFEQLRSYLTWSQSGKNLQLQSIRTDLEKAQQDKATIFTTLQAQYTALQAAGNQQTFLDWMKTNGVEYTAAWDREEKLEAAYSAAQDPSMDDVVRALDTMKSADSRLEEKMMSNMPCIALDLNYYTESPPATTPPTSPASTFYRPYHQLPNLTAQGQQWLWLSPSPPPSPSLSPPPQSLALNFPTALSTPWSTLGHPALDHAPAPPNPEVYDTLSARLDFAGLQSFSVQRGLWDVSHPRSLPPLAPSAPSYLTAPFYKTVSVLLGWGVDLVVTLPAVVSAADVAARAGAVSLMGVPVTGGGGGGAEIHVKLAYNAVPVLLGVVAQEI